MYLVAVYYNNGSEAAKVIIIETVARGARTPQQSNKAHLRCEAGNHPLLLEQQWRLLSLLSPRTEGRSSLSASHPREVS